MPLRLTLLILTSMTGAACVFSDIETLPAPNGSGGGVSTSATGGGGSSTGGSTSSTGGSGGQGCGACGACQACEANQCVPVAEGAADLRCIAACAPGGVCAGSVFHFGGTKPDVLFTLAATEDAGAVLGGRYEGGLGKDPSAATLAAINRDGYVVKVNANGEWAWSTSVGAPGNDEVLDVDVADVSGAVVAAGVVADSMVGFGDGFSPSPRGADDGFVVKYSAGGSTVWAQRLGGAMTDRAHAVAFDGSGDVLVVGTLASAQAEGACASVSAGAYVFVSKLDGASGACIWRQAFSASIDFDDTAAERRWLRLAVDSSGSAIVVGSFFNTINIGGNDLTASPGQTDLLAWKVDGAGNHLWSDRWGNADSQRGLAVAIDGSDDVWVGGYSPSLFTIGSVVDGGFVAKLGGNDGTTVFASRVEQDWLRVTTLARSTSGMVVGGVNFSEDATMGVLNANGQLDGAAMTLGEPAFTGAVSVADGAILWGGDFDGTLTVNGSTATSLSMDLVLVRMPE